MSAQAAEQAAARDERGAVLEAFARALRRETHVLQNRPEILWQQLYNRLRWEEEPVPRVLEPEFEERSKPDSTPWLRTRTPFRESSALLSILEGHSAIAGVGAKRSEKLLPRRPHRFPTPSVTGSRRSAGL